MGTFRNTPGQDTETELPLVPLHSQGAAYGTSQAESLSGTTCDRAFETVSAWPGCAWMSLGDLSALAEQAGMASLHSQDETGALLADKGMGGSPRRWRARQLIRAKGIGGNWMTIRCPLLLRAASCGARGAIPDRRYAHTECRSILCSRIAHPPWSARKFPAYGGFPCFDARQARPGEASVK